MVKKKLKREEKNIKNVEHIKPIKDKVFVGIPDNFSSESDLLSKFNEELTSNETIRELVSIKNIKLKTDLSDDQISLLTRILTISKLLRSHGEIEAADIFDSVANEFVTLNVSRKRQGRKEFVEANKTTNDFNKPMMGGFQNNPQQPNMR